MDGFYCSDRGFRMFSDDDSKEQYFIIEESTGIIAACTNAPDGVKWEKPHVHVPTRGIYIENAQVVNCPDKGWYVQPIDPSLCNYPIPDISTCKVIQGQCDPIVITEEIKQGSSQEIIPAPSQPINWTSHAMTAAIAAATSAAIITAAHFILK